MPSPFRSLFRALRLGKERYYVGSDLAGNSYYQRPHPGGPENRPKRIVDFAQHKDFSRYRHEDMPPQWASWLRWTRSDPPTIEELTLDAARLQRLTANVRRIDAAASEERQRRSAALEPPPPPARELPPADAPRSPAAAATASASAVEAPAAESAPDTEPVPPATTDPTPTKIPSSAQRHSRASKPAEPPSTSAASASADPQPTPAPDDTPEKPAKRRPGRPKKQRRDLSDAAPLSDFLPATNPGADFAPEEWKPKTAARR